ncbi:MAG: diguanylate cyclase [Spirochaetales bacterium]|nr:diguanylate cyclase [Spirochaetales bacterium]
MSNKQDIDICHFYNENLENLVITLENKVSHEKMKELIVMLKSQKEYVNSLFKQMGNIGLFIADIKNNRVYPNYLWYEMGYTEDEMKNHGFLKFVHPEDLELVKSQSIKILDNGKDTSKIVFRIKSKNSDWKWVRSATISILTDQEGNVEQYIGFDTDITKEMEAKEKLENALRQAEQARKKAERKALEATTIEEAGAIISSTIDLNTTLEAILDQAEKVIPFNTSSIQILNKDRLVIIGGRGWKNPEIVIGFSFLYPGANPNTKVIRLKKPIIIDDIITENLNFTPVVKEYKGRSWLGIPLIFREKVIGMMTFDKNEKDFFTEEHKRIGLAFASHVANALENARLYEELKEMAMTDPLTGAKNRRAFFEFAEQHEKLFKRYKSDFAVIMLDIDFFKRINDKLGHQEGDIVLQNLVKYIYQELRDTDILGRYGGEEFVILLPRSSEADAYEIAERIRKKVKKQSRLNNSKASITISLGCANMGSSNIKNIDSLISMADKALYYAKEHGRDQSQRFSNLSS